MHKQIFRAFLVLTMGLLIAASVTAVLIHQFLKTQDEIRHLHTFGTLLSDAINHHGWDFLKQSNPRWIRISLIDSDGTVLYDSLVEHNKLDNHLKRAEVTEALTSPTGTSNVERYSNTLHKPTFYHSIKLKSGQILRLSFASDTLYLYTGSFTSFLSLILLGLVGACYLIATRLSHTLIDPINSINLNDLSRQNAPPPHTYPELQPFIQKITLQQHKIDEQINKLRLKNNEFQAITKSMSDGLVLLNAQGKIVSINKTARKIFAVTKENCINQSYLAIDNSQYMRDIIANSGQQPRQTMNIVKDGRDYEIRFSTITDNNTCVGYVLIILDVTEKKRTEQLRQEFTANVSHELKTPLQSIIGYSELMASGIVPNDDIKHFASRIHRQSSRLKTLIEDIIFLSRLDEGQITIIEEISLHRICQEVFDNLQEKADERKVSLVLSGEDLKFNAVNRYIYELIYNLVDNAIRYNLEGGQVTVNLSSSTNKYQIEVSDTGIGIAHEEQFRIFERFYRVDKSHSRQTGGTGLGLSIVKRVVLYHMGKLKISSQIGQGTTFTVTFYKDRLQKLQETNERRHQQLRLEQAAAEKTTDSVITYADPATPLDLSLEISEPDAPTAGAAAAGNAAASVPDSAAGQAADLQSLDDQNADDTWSDSSAVTVVDENELIPEEGRKSDTPRAWYQSPDVTHGQF